MALSAIERRFLQQLVAERPVDRRSDTATAFCSQFAIGRHVGARVEYVGQDYVKAQQLLEAEGVSVSALPAGASRADAAIHRGMSEKSGTRAPHAGSVAIKALGACSFGPQTLWTPPGGYLVCDATVAALVDADRLLLVENLETFRQIERYSCVDRGAYRVLTVFRGDRVFSARASQELLESRSEPVWAFVDFDPAGLGIAAGLPRLERLVLPPQSKLVPRLRGARSVELYERSSGQWGALLEQAEHPEIRSAWQIMRTHRGGLAQESMRDLLA
jgi:hypothetical protein